MKRIIFLLLLMLSGLEPTCFSQSLPGYEELAKKLMGEFETPGVALAIMDKFEFREFTFGYAEIQKKEIITSQTLFNVASISKLVTGIAVMELVEQGKVNLDRPIEDYLTRYKFPSGTYDSKKVTTRLILDHSAGLSTEFGPGFAPGDSLLPLENILSGQSPKRKALRIVSEPGNNHVYSNVGFGLLQLLIEEVSGISFGAYMDKYVFGKLHMKESGFTDPVELLQNARLATPYNYRNRPLQQERFVVLAAAGLITSLADMEKLMLEETRNHMLLTKETYKKMIEVDSSNIYGLAHIVHHTKNDGVYAGHTGLGMGWNSSYQFIPGTGQGIIVLTNGDNGYYVHNMLLGYWYYTLTGQRLENCKTAPDKVLNRLGLYIEIAAEKGMLEKADAENYLREIEEARKELKVDNFAGFVTQLNSLETTLAGRIKDAEIKTNLELAFQECYFWMNMPWFSE